MKSKRWVLMLGMVMIAVRLLALPVPDIRANGQGGALTIAPTTSVTLAIMLNAGANAGTEADWWLAAEAFSEWYSFLASSWSWFPGITPAYQGGLFDLGSTEFFQTAGLPVGTYRLYFGVDLNRNGVLDYDSLTYDVVTLNVESGQTNPPVSTNLVQLSDIVYLGAFRLPGDTTRPKTFAYGGSAMAYCPSGDAGGASDGFPGSLYIAGHDRMPYGDLPNGNQVAEVTVPAPVISTNLDALNEAAFLQNFNEVAPGLFDTLDEIPRMAMQYLNATATGPKIHLAWGQHHQNEDTPAFVPSIAWFDLTLSSPAARGAWYIGNQSLYSVSGYLLEIPSAWGNTYAGGRPLATGRYRDGGWSGQGPVLFAYQPWQDASGTPPATGTRLSETVLLLYEKSVNSDDVVSRSLQNYQHPDHWNGGAWLTTSSGKTAVLFAGTKGTGAKYWYGYVNPNGPEYPCVDTDMIGEMEVCRLADGTPCPPADLLDVAGHNDARGWWSSRFDAQFILYDPAQMAGVAAGTLNAWDPQPYATLDIDEHLFLNPSGVETEEYGTGVQRRHRLGAVTYDRSNDLLYVIEILADGTKPVVHVWRIR